MIITPTARRERREDGDWVVYERRFAAPIADVWAAVTEPDRLQRWVGTYAWTSGGPGVAGSTVGFRMTAEGEDAPEEIYTVRACEPPRRLHLHSVGTLDLGQPWLLELDLAESAGTTTLTFAQRMDTAEIAGSVGPGWEYYLDRLLAAETGGDVNAVSWPAYEDQGDHFRELFS